MAVFFLSGGCVVVVVDGEVDRDRSLLDDEDDDPEEEEDRDEDDALDEELREPPVPADFLLESESETLERDALLDFLAAAGLHFFAPAALPDGTEPGGGGRRATDAPLRRLPAEAAPLPADIGLLPPLSFRYWEQFT